MSTHICECLDCNPAPFDDTCKFEAEVEQWKERCRNLTDPNPGGWTEALHEAHKAREGKYVNN